MRIYNAAIVVIALSLPPAAVLAGSGSKGGKNGLKNSKASKTAAKAKAYRYGSYSYSSSMSMSTGGGDGDRDVVEQPTPRPSTQTPQPDGGEREVVDQPTPRPTPVPTNRNVVTPPPTKSPTTPVIPDAPPTTQSPMAGVTPSPAGVTPSPPPVGPRCSLSGFVCQSEVSCTPENACEGSTAPISLDGACNGNEACKDNGNTIAYCSCNGDTSCIENGGTINNCAWYVQFRFRHCFGWKNCSLMSFLFVLQQR